MIVVIIIVGIVNAGITLATSWWICMIVREIQAQVWVMSDKR